MSDIRNIIIGAGIALGLALCMLFAHGSAELFIYNNF